MTTKGQAAVEEFRAQFAAWADGEAVSLLAAVGALDAASGDQVEPEDVLALASLCRHLAKAAERMTISQIVSANSLALDEVDRLMDSIAAGLRPLAGAEAAAAEAIAKARAEVAELEDELEERAQQLSEAADAVDLVEIQRLRPLVEVEIPGRLGEARIRLLEARIARARLPIPAAEETSETKVAEAAKAVERVASLTSELRKASENRAAAERIAAKAQAEVGRLVRELDVLESEHGRLAEAVKAAQRRAVLRLAGLEEPQTATVH